MTLRHYVPNNRVLAACSDSETVEEQEAYRVRYRKRCSMEKNRQNGKTMKETICTCMKPLILCCCILAFLAGSITAQSAEDNPWVVYQGGQGPGEGKHIVFVSGDEEYRSEEALPALAKILAYHHGFKCTVLFAIDPESGEIDPEYQTNIPGLEQLQSADLMVLFTRFRELPDEQMKYIDTYTQAGKPVVALRTATHAFHYTRNLQSPYAKYSFNSKVAGWQDGYGRQVLGETWVAHHGEHGKQGTRGLINGLHKDHPVLQGAEDIWGPTDVYAIRDLSDDAQILVFGQVTEGMSSDAPMSYKTPIMPVAWTKQYESESGNTARVFATTMGASVDLENEDLRRLLVNACYWGMKMEQQISEESTVDIVGDYDPTMFGFGDHQKGLRPTDFAVDQKTIDQIRPQSSH